MKPRYSKGDTVKMTRDALENYGAEYAGKVYEIGQWYDHYVPQRLMKNNDPHGHPGYDAATGDCLYHLKGLNFDLYEWELLPA